MCTLVILRRPEHRWPLIVGANREEMANRPWAPPGRHWPDRDHVVAGQDLEAGGSWLGINDFGVIAGIMNRRGSLGPEANKRSRGELVLEALDHADAAVAARALSAIDPGAYRPFNLFIGDNQDAFWLRSAPDGDRPAITMHQIPPGVSMITAWDLNDVGSARIGTYLPRFQSAPAPDPDQGDWSAWRDLLASREFDPNAGPNAGPRGALCVVTDGTYGTLSSSLIAVGVTDSGAVAKYLFCGQSPHTGDYEEVEL